MKKKNRCQKVMLHLDLSMEVYFGALQKYRSGEQVFIKQYNSRARLTLFLRSFSSGIQTPRAPIGLKEINELPDILCPRIHDIFVRYLIKDEGDDSSFKECIIWCICAL